MKSFRLSRPSPALVISLVALFIALGGTGYAALHLPKNSVGSKQLKKNAVIGSKIKGNAVTGSKVKNGSLTGADIQLSSLGTVPNATSATNATNATNASNATHASSADSAKALTTLPSGQSESGYWAVAGTTSSYAATGVTFPQPLAAPSTNVEVTPSATPSTHCSGPGHAAAGWFCLYVGEKSTNATFYAVFDPLNSYNTGVGVNGTLIYYTTTNTSQYADGTWTVTAA